MADPDESHQPRNHAREVLEHRQHAGIVQSGCEGTGVGNHLVRLRAKGPRADDGAAEVQVHHGAKSVLTPTDFMARPWRLRVRAPATVLIAPPARLRKAPRRTGKRVD